MSEPLQVWVLSDNRPGHYNQSRGIVTALQRLRPVETHWLGLSLRVGLMRNPLRWLLNRGVPPSPAWLKSFYRMQPLAQTPCDLIVSTGGKTSFANAWLARRCGAQNIFAGSLRRLSPELFDAVLTLEPLTPAAPSNLVVDLPPCPLDARMLDARGENLRSRLKSTDETLWALLLGGDGAGYRYRNQDWRALAALLNRLAAVYGIRWLLVSSRRTGQEAEKLLKSYANGSRIAASCWYPEAAGTSVVADYLGAAEKIFVTEDSMTMLTEAIYSQRPVISLRPAEARADRRYGAMLQRFSAKGWISRHAIAALAADTQPLQTARTARLEVSPLERLSQQLQARLRL